MWPLPPPVPEEFQVPMVIAPPRLNHVAAESIPSIIFCSPRTYLQAQLYSMYIVYRCTHMYTYHIHIYIHTGMLCSLSVYIHLCTTLSASESLHPEGPATVPMWNYLDLKSTKAVVLGTVEVQVKDQKPYMVWFSGLLLRNLN